MTAGAATKRTPAAMGCLGIKTSREVMSFNTLFSASFLVLCLIVGKSRAADEAASSEETELRSQISRLLADLDSNRFDTRRRAASTLEKWIERPEMGGVLADEFQRRLIDPGVSFEVRWRLERWARRLPEVSKQPVEEISPAELERLIAELDADSYALRLGASRRIRWLAQNPKLAYPIATRLKQRMADPNLSLENLRRLEPIWQEARGVWVSSDPAGWHLPPVSDEQLRGWIDDYARPAGEKGAVPHASQAVAERELLDLVARDDYVARVGKLIQRRLEQPIELPERVRLAALGDSLRPAMVAEYWSEHRHGGEQHLIVGVPSLGPQAIRPSYFDRIDDRVAHCVSGHSLEPGDYPVGVAFPHPLQENALFCLVNLPTPRRQMIYAQHVKTSEAKRLAELSRRTFDRFLEEKRPLSDRELEMLRQLDYRELSRFAGRYFALVDDEPIVWTEGANQNRTSRHAAICALLVVHGTQEAVPGLTRAILDGRILQLTAAPAYHIGWWAVLTIADRDPWPDVDAWLARYIARTDLLIEGVADERPELGATAAALLLRRHHQTPSLFGLRSEGLPPETIGRVEGYRFQGDDDRARVQRWWDEERQKAAHKGPAQAKGLFPVVGLAALDPAYDCAAFRPRNRAGQTLSGTT
jgi:hypothetical protein